MKKVCYILLFVICFSCKNKLETPTNSENTQQQLDSTEKENLRQKNYRKRDSIIKANNISYYKSISHIKNINDLTNIDNVKLNSLLDSLPIVKLPIGDRKSFFYNYPKTQESYYGKREDYDVNSIESYLKDSIATAMSQKAFFAIQNQIKELNQNTNIENLEILLDSTIVGHRKGLPLKFIGVLQKTDNYTALLYQPSLHYYNDSYKIITVNTNGEIIDMLGLTKFLHLPPYYEDGLYTNDLNFIDKKGQFYVKRFIVFAKSESTSDFVRYEAYKIDHKGKIVRYFELAEGNFEKKYSSNTNPNFDFYLEYENGQIENHRKNGKWKEIKMTYNDESKIPQFELKIPIFVESEYKNGLKDGIWKYYNLMRDTLTRKSGNIEYITTSKKGKHLIMEETYSNNILKTRTVKPKIIVIK